MVNFRRLVGRKVNHHVTPDIAVCNLGKCRIGYRRVFHDIHACRNFHSFFFRHHGINRSAHLAVVNENATSGHNVVIDGYRESDNKFHINFGWGGSYDNWYSLPDPGGYHYGWTKIEGVIANIIPANLAVHETSSQLALDIYPNPVSDVLHINNLPCDEVKYSIFNMLGQTVKIGTTSGTVYVADLEKGIYFLQIKDEKLLETVKFIVK